jgi:hypothetical protein
MLGVALVALVLPGAAVAGTYDVVACNAPGAGGVNSSWAYETPPALNGDVQPEAYRVVGDCASGITVGTQTPTQVHARYTTSGVLAFNAPAGTRIMRVRLSRYGESRPSSDDPNTPEPEYGRWMLFSQTAEGGPVGPALGGEQCEPVPGGPVCKIGAINGGPGSEATYATNTTRVVWGVLCGGPQLAYCFTNAGPGFGNYPLAGMTLYGATVTLQDDSRPAVSTAGALFESGWHDSADSGTIAAADNSGIRSLTVSLNGAVIQSTRPRCDARQRVPCGSVPRLPIDLSRIADGQHTLRIDAADASGNHTVVDRAIAVDRTPPAARLLRSKRRTIRIAVDDAASGVASGEIQVRNSSAEAFRALPTTLADGRLEAPLDTGRVSRTDVRVAVRDNAGNAAVGAPTRLSLSARGLRRSRANLRYGRRLVVRGRVTLSARQPVAGGTVSAARTGGAAEATATVSDRGRFRLVIPPGPSRRLRITYGGSGEALPALEGVRLEVRATSTLRASRRNLSGPGRVRFSGRVPTGGQLVPRNGIVVVLQGFSNGRWQTFADARTRPNGRWRASYPFRGIPGTYPVRARVRPTGSFPFEIGYSRTIRIRVR